MTSQMVKCRVCGKEHKPCKSAKYDPTVFNWREVACSPQCGQIYLERIIASRAPAVEKKTRKSTKKIAPKIEAEDIVSE